MKYLAYWTVYCGIDNGNGYVVYDKPSKMYDCYFLTNNNTLKNSIIGKGYIYIFIEDIPISIDERMNSIMCRYPEILSHNLEVLQKYEYTCYYDSKRIIDNEWIETYISNNDVLFAVRRHPCLFNVFEDFTVAMLQDRYHYDYKTYIKLINDNTKCISRFSTDYFETSVIIRKNCEIVRCINEKWLQSYIEYKGCHEQLHFNIISNLYIDNIKFILL